MTTTVTISSLCIDCKDIANAAAMIELLALKSPGSRLESDHEGAGAEAALEVEPFTAGTNDEL